MKKMFSHSEFNGDLSKWKISNVNNMSCMFEKSKFNKNLTNWKPYRAIDITNIFELSEAPIPYWSKFNDVGARKRAIGAYLLQKELHKELNNNDVIKPKKLKM
jgi:hypothetical protein